MDLLLITYSYLLKILSINTIRYVLTLISLTINLLTNLQEQGHNIVLKEAILKTRVILLLS